MRKLEKRGILWQIKGKKKWIAAFLGNEKAKAPLLKFLKITNVEGKERAREKELE